MKKIIYLLIAICALTNLSSCTDKNDTEPEKNPDAIVGTSWRGVVDEGNFNGGTYIDYGTLMFNDNGKVSAKEEYYENGVLIESEINPGGSYTYNAPNGTITDPEGATMNFTIKGNNLTIVLDGESLVLVKQ